MSASTIPIFVVGSGRSGTRAIFKLLSGIAGVEVHHEYLCTHIQPVAAKYFMRRISYAEAQAQVQALHGSAIYYSQANVWVDCSNKLSWLIEPLAEVFSNAKFVHLVRDGRKVASSFFHKLSDEMYDDESVRIMQQWLARPTTCPEPPPEKKYWWNIPQADQPFAAQFASFNQFQRACYQWREANRVIIESLRGLPADRQLFVKLERLTSDRQTVREFLAFFGVPAEEKYYEFLQTPQNVIFPMDFKLTGEQRAQFQEIAQDMMEQLGYAGTDEYEVEY